MPVWRRRSSGRQCKNQRKKGLGKMFSKPWQSLAFVGGVLVLVVIIFGSGDRPTGLSSAVEVAQNSAAQRASSNDEISAQPASAEAAPQFDDAPVTDTAAEDGSNGFADFQIEQYGAPQASAAPANPGGWAPNNTASGSDRPQGPPPPGMRNSANATPRILPQDPSTDPNLIADLRRVLDKK